MVVLRRFSDSVAAETLRGRLAVAGIDAFVRGTSIEAAFGLGGAPTSSGLRLEIAKDDVDAALQVIEQDDRLREIAGDWICSRCDEENDASFEFCWKCQKERGPNDTKQAATQPQVNPIASPESKTSDQKVSRKTEKANPYRPVLVDAEAGQMGSDVAGELQVDDETIDNTLRSLFRLACVSAMIIPIPLAFYAVYRTLTLPAQIKRHLKVRRRFRGYLLCNGLLSLIVVAFWTAVGMNLIR